MQTRPVIVLPPALIVLTLLSSLYSSAAMPVRPPQAARSGRTVWDGVYTADQARRGQTAYMTNCSGCHLENLAGKNTAPALNGDGFMERWREYDLDFLLTMIRTQMPPARARVAGKAPLSDSTYLDILTHLLQGNGFPAGSEELTPAMAERVQLVGKDGPKPVPSGALVLVVGCLTQVSDLVGVLNDATEPVRTKVSDHSSPPELQSSAAMPSGSQRFRLVNFDYIAADFRPEVYVGQRVQAKGFLVKQANADRINVTALERVAASCPQ